MNKYIPEIEEFLDEYGVKNKDKEEISIKRKRKMVKSVTLPGTDKAIRAKKRDHDLYMRNRKREIKMLRKAN